MGITGTWEGYAPGTMDVYNRGAFGAGYSINSFKAIAEDIIADDWTDASSIANEVSQIRVNMKLIENYKSTNLRNFGYFSSNSLINFSPYNTLNITFSYAYGHEYGSAGDKLELEMFFRAYNSDNVLISGSAYHTATNETGLISWNSGAAEKTASVNISSYNGLGGFKLLLYSSRGSYSKPTIRSGFEHTSYIQKIWFT